MEYLTQKNKKNLDDSSYNRIIDANLNRLREGLRVIEDIMRYNFDHHEFASTLKSIRHKSKTANYISILKYRDSINDTLKNSTKDELKRNRLVDVVIANFKRTQESSRVLEEILKIEDIKSSENFKLIRYQLYELEKQILLTFFS